MVNRTNAFTRINVERNNINVLHASNVLKIPRWSSLAGVGDEPGMEGDIILNRLTGQFCFHDGITWQCLFGGDALVINAQNICGCEGSIPIADNPAAPVGPDDQPIPPPPPFPYGEVYKSKTGGAGGGLLQFRRIVSSNDSISVITTPDTDLEGCGAIDLKTCIICTECGLLSPPCPHALVSPDPALGVDVGLTLQPLGLGALTAECPDGTNVGGDCRGDNAVDWQMSRALATEVASGNNSFLGNGAQNTASGLRSGIMAGFTNTATTTNAVVGGGNTNIASGVDSIVGAGASNTALSTSSGVLAGFTNSAADTNAGVVCGSSNTASGSNCVVGGGSNNTSAGISSGVLAGLSNSVTGTHCSICGGTSNTIAAPNSNSAILAGTDNTILGGRSSSTILAGNDITINVLDQAAFTKDLALEAATASPSEGTHIYTAQVTTPTVSISGGGGVASVVAESTDTAGSVDWTPAITPAIITILYNEPYAPGTVPIVVLQPRTPFGGDLHVFPVVSNIGFDVTSLAQASFAHDFFYHVIATAALTEI